MKQRIVIVYLLLMMAWPMMAEWYVFAQTGKVEYWQEETWCSLRKGQPLTGKELLRMEKNASLTVMDTEKKVAYVLQDERARKVKDLIADAQPSAWEKFWKLAMAVLHNEAEEIERGAAGTVYRDASADQTVAAAIRQRMQGSWATLSLKESDYRMELQIMQFHQAKIVSQIMDGDRVEYVVTNHSRTPLFVAIVDIDDAGVISSALPCDEVSMLTKQLIPSLSTAVIDIPIVFTPSGRDHLVLIAYPEPFDMEHVLKILEETEVGREKNVNAKIGVAHCELIIR